MTPRRFLTLSAMLALACGRTEPAPATGSPPAPPPLAAATGAGAEYAAIADAGAAAVSPTYAESSALVAMTADGETEIGLRIARFPGRGEGTLWFSAFVGDERYGVAQEDVELGDITGPAPVERAEARFAVSGPAQASIECRDRHTAEMVCTAHAEAMTHEDLHPPLGTGTRPLRIDAVFRARHVGDQARPGRMEVFGTVEGTIETPHGIHRFSSRGKYHEQTGERPRFAGPFTYFAIQGEGGSLLARTGGGTVFGFALLDGTVVDVGTFTIDPLGAPERSFHVELADGRSITGKTTIVRETSVPIEGERRSSATVQVSTNHGAMIGHLNDWQPPESPN